MGPELDHEQTDCTLALTTKVLWWVIIAFILQAAVHATVILFAGIDVTPRLAPVVVLLLAAAPATMLLVRQQVKPAADALCVMLWFALMLASYFAGGIDRPIYSGSVLLLIAVTLLMGSRACVLYAAATMLAGILMLIGQCRGWVPGSTSPGNAIAGALINLVAIAGATISLLAGGQAIRRTLQSSRERMEEAQRLAARLMEEMTARAKVETELRDAKQIAEAANSAKDSFLGRMSHELRTPLTPVLLSLSDLTARESLPADLREELAMMQRHVEVESHLIDDLLELASITSSKMHLQSKATDLHRVIQGAVDAIEADFADADIHLNLELLAESPIVMGNAQKLEQALWNLLRNALKYTRPGGNVVLRTRIGGQSGEAGTDIIQIEIEDDGVGIDPELLPRLFTPFTHGDPLGHGTPAGFGIGLTFCKKAIEAHKGTILIYSDGKGKGTRVTITLPICDPSHARDAEAMDLPAGVGLKLRILLVEDHAATARILSSLLESDGHEVLLAHSVAEAKQHIATCEFDLLLSDLGLPDGHGSELPPLVKRRQDIPCIAISGYGQPEELERSQRAGFITHVVKPVTIGQLRTVIATIYNQPALRRT